MSPPTRVRGSDVALTLPPGYMVDGACGQDPWDLARDAVSPSWRSRTAALAIACTVARVPVSVDHSTQHRMRPAGDQTVNTKGRPYSVLPPDNCDPASITFTCAQTAPRLTAQSPGRPRSRAFTLSLRRAVQSSWCRRDGQRCGARQSDLRY